MQREQEIKSRVKGFLVPIFFTEEGLNGLSPGDFAKVKAGYACARCLAEFDTYTLRCPACGWERDLAADILDAPELWLDHMKNHNDDLTPYTETFNPLAGGEKLPDDIETIPVNKLKPSKWGRG